MPIFAVEKNERVFVYDVDTQKKLFDEQGELYQYTDSTVAIKRGTTIYVYGADRTLLAEYKKDFVDMSGDLDIILQVNQS